MNRLLQIVILLLCWNFSIAQHKISTGAKIKDKIINASTGILLIKTSDNLQGINPKAKLPIWNNSEINDIDFESYQEIPFTPYVLFEKKPLISSKLLTKTLGTKGVTRIVFDVSSGDVLFNSEAQGFKAVSNTFLLPEQQAILVDGMKGKDLIVALFSYKSGKLIWESKLTKSKFFKRLSGALFNKEIVTLDAHQNIFWLKNKMLLKINGLSGQIEYEQDDVHSITLNNEKDVLFLFTKTIQLEKLKNQTAVFAKGTNDLQNLWEQPTKISGTISETVIDKDQLITITSKGFNILNTKTGLKKWEITEPLPLIKKIVPIDDGYLVVQEQFLTKVGLDGKKAWEKHQKISRSSKEAPIHIFDDNDKALYLTPSFANVVSNHDGNKLWSDDVILNNADFVSRNLNLKEHYYRTWYDDVRYQFPVYSNNTFYIFNCNATSKPKPLYQFDFGRAIPKLDMIKVGYFIYHNNSYYVFNSMGELNYKKQYEPTEKDTFLDHTIYWLGRGIGTYTSAIGFVTGQINKTIKTVLVSQDLGFATGVLSGVYGSYSNYQNILDSYKNLEALGIETTVLDGIITRFKKGQEHTNAMLIVAPNKTEANYDVLRLHIKSGKEDILLKSQDEKLNFLIDQLENTIYFFDKNIIRIEKF